MSFDRHQNEDSSESRDLVGLDSQVIKEFVCIPGPKPSLPWIGTGWQYFKYIGRYNLSKLHEANQHKYDTYGPIVKEEYEWGKPIIHIFDPKDFETVFRSQGKCPMRPANEFVSHYRLQNKHKYPNVGLSNMMGEQWYQHRQLLAPALMSLKVIQNHIPSQNQICDDFLDYLWQIRDPSNDVLNDLSDATYRLALESICMMCLDSRLHCFLKDNTTTSDGQLLISATKLLFESYNELYYGIPFWKLFATNSYRKLDSAETCIYEIASKYIQMGFNGSTRDQTNANQSVLQTLLNTEGLTESDIKITIIDFIAGGIFTVSNTLCFLFYHLASNPEVQHKLFQEVSQVMGDSHLLTADMLADMPYLKACVKECFRLTNTVPGITRILPQPTVLSGYHVPQNRWLDESKKEFHAFALLPFGYGNRMCAGKRFSELELYLSTAKLIQKYEITAIQSKLDLKFSALLELRQLEAGERYARTHGPFGCTPRPSSEVSRTSLLGRPLKAGYRHRDPRYRKLQNVLYNFLERPRGCRAASYHLLM
ncbi:unnamed protein product [Oppiella nova]|uniref:Cytochrome P450 n=1 Tax=Oppiella nova TaxID=334625 RepID=A0A7R9LAW9_9ACAR|nr:unnamed protein product [Oppiella nova]CAG2161721.1 unnamed protein product [Oppiella nova]